jgi:nicotinamide-nucleotide amidase
MQVELVTIGNELLLGQTVDTNSAWIAQQLNVLGARVSRITSVSDTSDAILEILEDSGKRADIIILTGGLGPTSDDITKPVLCKFFDTRLTLNPAVFEHIQTMLAERGYEVNDLNKKQAEVPESAIILHNDRGTAPGLWFEKKGKIYISLPGVPFEMETLMVKRVMPKLREKFIFPVIFYKTVITQGSYEAQLAEKLEDFEAALPENISLAYLPSPGIIRLRLGTVGDDLEKLKRDIEMQILKLQGIIPEFIVGFNDDTLEMIIGEMLKTKARTLSVAESCTGGTIASMITRIPGSSAYFKGGIVAYSNEIKRDQLAIDPSLLGRYGAVSKQVVEDMAINTRLLFNTDYSVAVSGIAGPSGGTEEKPVGTIWIAVSCQGSTLSSQFRFGDNRERNIRRSSVTALNMLRKMIIDRDRFKK